MIDIILIMVILQRNFAANAMRSIYTYVDFFTLFCGRDAGSSGHRPSAEIHEWHECFEWKLDMDVTKE